MPNRNPFKFNELTTLSSSESSPEIRIQEEWKVLLKSEFEDAYFQDLIRFVRHEYQTQTVFPPGPQIFSAFNHTPLSHIKVVIIGQDPYHGAGQAHG